ncbi:unnamed protein product [Tuber aestivum]|uniref:Mid2 domain-containing protein n=1 Tax=Tuber aestivum TaxID=59557 RepID=A0A292PIK4_9PEZI|nr:unnamed protein product [Tuber aestivum]
MMRWSNSCKSVLPRFLLLLGSALQISPASPTAVVGSDLRPRGASPQGWIPPQTVTITETTRYTLTVLTTLTVNPGISTAVVTSRNTSATRSTTTQTSIFTSTTTTTVTPTPTRAPKIRRQVSQRPSTVTVTTTVWAFPDVTITSTISFTAPASLLTTMTSMSMTVATDIVTESTTTTSIVTVTATAGITRATGQGAVGGGRQGPRVEVIVGATFAASTVVALLVFLYVRFVRGKDDREVAIGEAGAAGAASANKRGYTPVNKPNPLAIKSLLHPRKPPYNPVPAGDASLLNPPYNPANTSLSALTTFPRSYPHQSQPHQNRHFRTSYSPPLAPTFPTSAAPSTYLPVSSTPPRLPQIYVTRTDSASTISSFSSSSHSDPPVPIHPLSAAGARLPPAREVQFHALTTAGEERRVGMPPQEEPVELEPSWHSLSRGGSGSSGGGISVRRKPLPWGSTFPI